MYERILIKIYKYSGNVKLSKFFTNIIMGMLSFITVIKYYLIPGDKGKITPVGELAERKFIPKKIKRNDQVMYDLSIIIPAYNSSSTIDNCLNSILKEDTDYNYEVIVINDGSKDDTLERLAKYNELANVTILSHENRGIAYTRNRGLEEASGKYIMFIDADDVIPAKTINVLLSKAFSKDYDIIEGNYLNVYGDGQKVSGKPLWEKDFEVDLRQNQEFIREIKGFPWGRIYKRELWDNVEYPMGFEYEDTIIRFTIFRRAETFAYINKNIYEYTLSTTSISSRLKGTLNSLDTYFVAEYLLENNKYIGLEEDEVFYKIVLNQFSSMLYYRSIGVDNEYKRYILSKSAETLMKLENYCPKLSKKDEILKKAILDKNLKRWEICCKWR